MKDGPSALSDDEFTLFQKLLIEESGLYFSKDKSNSLCSTVNSRILELGYKSYQEYYNFLKFYPEGKIELRELFDLVTIGETFFFRNLPHFEALMKFVLPEIIRKKEYLSLKSLRLWSAGCSKGAEPYSIAIAIMEALGSCENWNISILGTDINRDALVSAKEAIYGVRDIQELPEGYLEKYFQRRGSSFILNENVKEMVNFEYHNLAKDSFKHDAMINLDMIFCRNVTIYFDLETTKRVIDNFYNCLLRDGYFFIGHSETLWQITNKFEMVEFPKTFIYKKTLYQREKLEEKPFVSVPEINLEDFMSDKEKALEDRNLPEGAGLIAETKFEPQESNKLNALRGKFDSLLFKEATKLFHDKKYEEALLLLEKIIAKDKDQTRAYFAKATILANQERYQEAINELTKIISVDNLYIEAYFLLGVLSYKLGDFKQAEAQFRKVIYVDPGITLAYLNLGNIFLYQKEFSKAAKEFNNAIKLLEKKARDEMIRFSEDFTVDFLISACKNNLTKIAQRVEGKQNR